MVLVLEGFRVSTAPDAMTGLAVAYDHHPDVIVLDLGLPGDDGFAFLERLRARTDLPFIPVIVFSGTFDESVKGRAFGAGAKRSCRSRQPPMKLSRRFADFLPELCAPSRARRVVDGRDDPALVPRTPARVPACSKRAARLGKRRPSLSIAVHLQSDTEQGNHRKPQVDNLRRNELIIRWLRNPNASQV
jgi:CheY-like chemotaxis protein